MELWKGNALYLLSLGTRPDDAKLAAALATFDEARRLDSSNLSAWYLPGTYLDRMRRSSEGYPLLKKALTLAPDSTDVHSSFWRAIMANRQFSQDQKKAEIESDTTALLEKHGHRPGALLAVFFISRDMKLAEKRQEVEEKLLKEFPDSREAEWALVYRWTDVELKAGPEGIKDAAQIEAYRQMLRAFIRRPKHYNQGLVGEAYRNLFGSMRDDKTVSGDELYQVIEGVVKHERMNPHITYVATAITLADRKTHLAEAERIARDGIAELRKKVESQRSFYKSQGEYERAIDAMTARAYDALGWVLFSQGRLEEAEKELLQSYELNHENRDNLHHLGRLSESKNDTTKAEEYYVKGLGVQGPGKNPCEDSLKSFYGKRHGSLEGFETYLTRLREADRDRRKGRILGDMIAKPEAAAPFNLKSLDGKQVSLESLKGKIVAINFWGIWCGWCVQEMPDFQKLHDKYGGDPEVVILTINNDANPDNVPPWMREKGYSFTVLLDDGYVSKAGIQVFPTTWFLDPQGQKTYVKRGWSEKLLEEFAWRIEALRSAARVSAKLPP